MKPTLLFQENSTSPTTSSRNQSPWFPSTNLPFLPTLSLDTQHSRQHEYPNSLPEIQQLPCGSSKRTRGAPKKEKNLHASALQLKNTSGKPFLFSFIPQIIIAHLHHLFSFKGRSRYNKHEWLRLSSKEGVAMTRLLKRMVGENQKAIKFKRTVSMRELKDWLSGFSFDSDIPLTQQAVSDLRTDVFRKMCILKCFELNTHFASDFNVKDTSKKGAKLIRDYITHYLWQELELPTLIDEEVTSTFSSALAEFSN